MYAACGVAAGVPSGGTYGGIDVRAVLVLDREDRRVGMYLPRLAIVP